MSHIKDMVENPHPIYTQNANFWNFLLDSYEGGIDYTGSNSGNQSDRKQALDVTVNGKKFSDHRVNSNLFRHKKELSEDFAKRIDMSYYYNFCSPIIDIYTNHLFKQSINEDFGVIQKTIDIKRDNIDRKMGSIEEYRRDLSELAQIYGHVYTIVDSPRNVGEIRTEQDRIDGDVFPYVTLFHPQKVLNWALDTFGQPWWVLVCETMDANVNPEMFSKDKRHTITYRLWTRDDWFLYDEGYNLIDQGLHGLGMVPIVCTFNKQSKKNRNFLGISAIADIAMIARDVYNLCSELREIIRNQTFSILALQGNPDEFDAIGVGTGKALIYKENTNQPQYVAPPDGPAKVIQDQIDRQISKMFELASLEAGKGNFKGQSAVSQSGVSKAWDFHETNAELSKKALNLEDAEHRIWRVYSMWEGKDFDGRIEYPREFSVSELMEDLEEAEKLMKMNLGKTFNDEVKKAIVKKKFPKMEDNEIDAILEEGGTTPANNIINRVPFLRDRANANSGGNGGTLNG